MPLFQQSVIKKHIESFDAKHIEEKWQLFKGIFHTAEKQQNIRNSKEEQYQSGFLNDLFVKVLGYTLNPDPNFNLLTEQKNVTNSKKADGAIILDGKAIGVIELKGTETTDLNKIEIQAFGYKNNQPGCNYVITSNFEKLRFYIDNTTQQEEFNLFTLTKAQFELLYACLAWESIKSNTPTQILNESVSKENTITKSLYKDYSEFKRALFANLVELNPHFDKLVLFKKTQKLLDRFLFIFFAEDRGLLPTNLIFRINKEWENIIAQRIQVSLYDRYKMYFNDLNVGAKVTLPAFGKKTGEAITAEFEIFAYNGGLFIPDEILDNIKIDDTLLHSYTQKMSHYNFESDVDVNILGHIFENSLNEIDEIKSEIEGNVLEKTKTRRKKDGVFYTPKYITKYIVDNTIGKLCAEKKEEIKLLDEDYITDKKLQTKTKKALLDKLTDYRNWLLDLTICDPACGSGAFLNQALEFLIAEHRYVDELQAKLLGDSLILSDIENSILERNIYGVDLNDESVEIAKLSLWLRTAQKGRKLNSLNNNIKCGNSLIDDPSVAGDKAFSWEKEFPEVFVDKVSADGTLVRSGGFDVVIGNPPWGAKINTDELVFIKKTHQKIIVRMTDSFMFFVDKSIDIIKLEGAIGLIIPDVILYQQDNEKLRKKILDETNLTHAINVGDGIFEDVAMPSAVVIAKKSKQRVNTIVGNFDKRFKSDLLSIPIEEVDQNLFLTLPNLTFATKGIEGYALLNRLSKMKLKDFIDEFGIQRGISPDLKDAFIVDRNTINEKNLEQNKIYKTVTGGVDVKKYIIPEIDKYILYIGKNDDPNQIPNIINHIAEYKERITCTEVKEGKHPFYTLHRTRDERIFDKPEKIIGVITGDSIITAVDFNKLYPTDGLYLFSVKNGGSNCALSCILNSKLITYLYRLISSESGRTMAQVKPVLVSELPMFELNEKTKNLLNSLYIKQKNSNLDLHRLIEQFGSYLKKLMLFELTSKLQSWHKLEFVDFIIELNKAIKALNGTPLTKKDEFEWMDLFEENKKKALELKAEIDKTDKEIDGMVYELYGLSEEEIKIVEGEN